MRAPETYEYRAREVIYRTRAITLTSLKGGLGPLTRTLTPTLSLTLHQVIYRTWGAQDDKHPYIQHMLAPGKTHCLGGEVRYLVITPMPLARPIAWAERSRCRP